MGNNEQQMALRVNQLVLVEEIATGKVFKTSTNALK